MLWEAGKYYDYDTFDSMVRTVHNNINTNKLQNTVDLKDTKILALHTEITEVREELKKACDNGPNSGTSSTPAYMIE